MLDDAPRFEDDEPWDEHQWEAFLHLSDRRLDRLMSTAKRYVDRHPRPADGPALERWKDGLLSALQRQGWQGDGLPLFLFLGDPLFDDLDDEDDAWTDALEMAEPFDRPADPFSDADENPDDPLRSFERVPVYRRSFDLAISAMRWSDGLPGRQKDDALVEFCAALMQVPAKVAAGHGFGFERDTLGGNIASVKRALAAANKALAHLREMRTAPYMDEVAYLRFAEDTFEVRNQLGIYVQELRARYDLGID